MEVKRKRRKRKKSRIKSPELTQFKINAKFGHRLKHGLSFLIFLICIVGGINAMRFAFANLAFSNANQKLIQWSKDGEVRQDMSIEEAKDLMQTATGLNASYAMYADALGQIVEWGVHTGIYEQSQLELAKEYYLKASESRPTWPVTWANLAMIKWRQQQFDEELSEYLNKASQYGSQTPEVHLLFVQLGLSLYKDNHPFYIEIKDTVRSRLALALLHPQSNEKARQFIHTTEQLKTACRWLAQDKPEIIGSQLMCDEKTKKLSAR